MAILETEQELEDYLYNAFTQLTYTIDFKDGLILEDGNEGWFRKEEDFGSLKQYLPEVMPDFLGFYKSVRKYNLRKKRKVAVIPPDVGGG